MEGSAAEDGQVEMRLYSSSLLAFQTPTSSLCMRLLHATGVHGVRSLQGLRGCGHGQRPRHEAAGRHRQEEDGRGGRLLPADLRELSGRGPQGRAQRHFLEGPSVVRVCKHVFIIRVGGGVLACWTYISSLRNNYYIVFCVLWCLSFAEFGLSSRACSFYCLRLHNS